MAITYRTRGKQIQRYLFEYLSQDVDPYDFSMYLPEYLIEMEIEVDDPHEFYPDQLTPVQLKSFKKWLIATKKPDDFVQEDPAGSPAYLSMKADGKLPDGTWLLHFTDAYFSAFDRGASLEGLQLSTWTRNKKLAKCPDNLTGGLFEVVFGFAFEATDRNLRAGKKYGNRAVLFQCNCGVSAYHYGDEEHQVIFPICTEYNAIPLVGCGGDALSLSHSREICAYSEDGEEMTFDSLDDVVRYVERRELSGTYGMPRLKRIPRPGDLYWR